METGKNETRMMPEPEGPEQRAEKARRTREGFSGQIMGAFWRITGLDNLSFARKAAVLAVGTAGLVVLGLGIFTELPYLWLITAALVALPLVFHKQKGEEEYSEADSGTDPDNDFGQDNDSYTDAP